MCHLSDLTEPAIKIKMIIIDRYLLNASSHAHPIIGVQFLPIKQLFNFNIECKHQTFQFKMEVRFDSHF